MRDIKLALCPALRQLKHNDGSDGFIGAYDYEWINNYVERLTADLQKANERNAELLKWACGNTECDCVDYCEGSFGLESLREKIKRLESAQKGMVPVPVDVYNSMCHFFNSNDDVDEAMLDKFLSAQKEGAR